MTCNPCSYFNGGLAELPLKLWHGWVITSHRKRWMRWHIHAITILIKGACVEIGSKNEIMKLWNSNPQTGPLLTCISALLRCRHILYSLPVSHVFFDQIILGSRHFNLLVARAFIGSDSDDAPTNKQFCKTIGRPQGLGVNDLTHHSDVIMGAMASQIAGVSIICSAVCLGADQRKHHSFTPLAFVRGIHR